jgi:hypothetical protein
MPQKLLFVDGVTVTPAVALPGNVRADLELGHDALYGPFGDPDPIGDIPEADPGSWARQNKTCAWLVRKVQSEIRWATGRRSGGKTKQEVGTMVHTIAQNLVFSA